MRQSERYAVFSLELHLYFARIMKEHALFLMAGFTPANAAFIREADSYRQRFEALLAKAVQLADGVARQEVLGSGEVVTSFTLPAEEQTQRFTGISINQGITEREEKLRPSGSMGWRPAPIEQVRALNQTALRLLDGLISLKERVLSHVLSCRMFTMNYPLLIEHITREAKLYRDYVARLEADGDMDPQTMGDIEGFWNQIMMEHALFIRGLLDPTEGELVEGANTFAGDYALLLEQSRTAQDAVLAENSLEETERFRDFKTAGVRGIVACEIRSIILPLLADHVLREANHYIRLLND
jgi:hypothetical protein